MSCIPLCSICSLLDLPVSDKLTWQARLQGLQQEVLDGSDTNYSIALVCFFITYIVFSIPGTLMAKQINPSWSIAAGAMIWSIGATLQAAAFNRAGLFVCRLFVGVGEAFFGESDDLLLVLEVQPRAPSPPRQTH
jgi:MFS family permease